MMELTGLIGDPDSSSLMVQHQCEFDQDPSVPHVPSGGRSRTEPDSFMILFNFFLSLSVVLLLQHATTYEMADATTESQQVLRSGPSLQRTRASSGDGACSGFLNRAPAFSVQSFCCSAKPDHTNLCCGQSAWAVLR